MDAGHDVKDDGNVEVHLLDNVLRVGLFLAVLGMAGSTVWLGAIDKTTAAGITAALCIGLCIFVFLYRFKRFKGLGFEGELWEEEMEEAAELKRGLKDLSERVGENVFWQLGPGARFGGIGTENSFNIIERTHQNLEAVGIDRQKIEELKRPWHKCIMRDLANPITERVGKIIEELTKALDDEIAALGTPMPAGKMPQLTAINEKRRVMSEVVPQLNDLIWRDDYENVPRLLREAIDTNPGLTDEDRQAVYRDCADEFRDIDQYARDRTVRRPEVLNL